MAEIVLGIGCTHTPQLHTPAELWDVRAKRDRADGVPFWYRGRRLRYAEVEEERRSEDIGAQTTPDVCEERLQKAHAAIERVAGILADAAPDAVLVFGNDQDEMFLDDVKPAFTIMGAPRFENMPRSPEQVERLPPGIALADTGHLPDQAVELPGHPDLAEHIAAGCSSAGFDVAYSRRQVRADAARAQTAGMPHAYGFVYKQLMRDRPIPNVPVDTNTLYPPNQPTAARCLAFGEAVGKPIRAGEVPRRVAVIASGGLSHIVVYEALDREKKTAMARIEIERVTEYYESYFQAG